jgi:UDP-3-O-[3-hydroxymyristoyl] glucosamine N-acyltransferase
MRRLIELAKLVDGELNHSSELEISEVGRIASVSKSGITFANSKAHYERFLESDAVAAVVSGIEGVTDEPVGSLRNLPKPVIVVADAEEAFAQIATLFRPPVARTDSGIHPRAIVSETASIGQGATIHAGAVVMDGAVIGDRSTIFPNVTVMENCQIGQDTQVFPNVVLYENTILGDRVILHAGVVLGAYGFGYKSQTGKHKLSAQLGNVVIEDDVEIGANSTIDRGTFDSTRIGRGTKLDNLVMVGHNCDIGEDALLCSQVGIAGSCNVGNGVVMGGQVGVGDHLNIGDRSMVMAKSGLMHDVEAGQAVNGIPAQPARKHMQVLAVTWKLPEMRKKLKQLSKAIALLQQDQEQAASQPQALTDSQSLRDAA